MKIELNKIPIRKVKTYPRNRR